MRILLYNWVPSGSAITEGGGVALYLSNIARSLADQGHEVHVLSSGFRYGLFDLRLKIVGRGRDAAGIRYFDVMNSPVAAPSFFMFDAVPSMLECPELRAAIRNFMTRFGPFDVVHIQNVEGIGFDILSLAEVFPHSRFILSNHNYHVVCQQANLWHQDRERCTTYHSGARCHTCNVFPINMEDLVIDRFMRFHRLDQLPPRVARLVRKSLTTVANLRWRAARRRAWHGSPEQRVGGRRIGPADLFRLRRGAALEMVNRHCAAVISVSHATEDILISYGLDPAISHVRYIGTKHFNPTRVRTLKEPRPELRLAFLGYTRPDKGFQFLVEALEVMPEALWGCFSLTVAARISDEAAIRKIRRLRARLSDLIIQDGYKQAELPQLLAGIDLGLVLPLWDDALPQVAIEFVCHGVPILVTDRGGQQELAADPAFVFKAENYEDFWRRLGALWRDRSELERFWTLPRPLRTNAQHVDELLQIYQGDSRLAKPTHPEHAAAPSAEGIAAVV